MRGTGDGNCVCAGENGSTESVESGPFPHGSPTACGLTEGGDGDTLVNLPPSSSGLGQRPFTAPTPVQIRLGVPSKQCRECGSLKSLDHFYREAKGRYGVKARCKVCMERAKGRDPRSEVSSRLKPHGDYRVQDDGCWQWLGQLDQDGYGRTTVDYRKRLAHRVYYERHVGEIPEGLQLDHLCRNRACVNPSHLEPVTSAENTRRGMVARRAERRSE